MDWIAAIAVMTATAIFSITALCWTIRDHVPAIGANSEFFAYSWIYGLRWSAGETVFQPHSQLLFPLFAFISRLFGMTHGSAADIIGGWHRFALLWPIGLMGASITLITITLDRAAPAIDAMISAGLFLISVPLFLTDQALNSTSYHSLAVPLALASLLLWKHYEQPDLHPALAFYGALGIYTAACALGKPTFLAFAAPFFVMEAARALRTRRPTGLVVAAMVAVTVYLAWLLLVYRDLDGVREHFSKSLIFMRSQANWYDAEKGATPLHWYLGYVVGKMGWLPTALVVLGLVMSSLGRHRRTILAGALGAILCAMFGLYQRSQMHAEPEFMAVLLTTAIASNRCSAGPRRLAEIAMRLRTDVATPAAACLSAALLLWTVARPPETHLHGFAQFMASYDDVVVPALFEQPQDRRTLALTEGAAIFWGTADAWCRGEGNILDGNRSDLLDRAFGNIKCVPPSSDSSSDYPGFDRALYLRNTALDPAETDAEIAKAFPRLSRRLTGCAPAAPPFAGNYQLMACSLRRQPQQARRN